MKFFLQVILAASLVLITNHSFLMADTNNFCADKWPNDSKLREDCQNQQIEAHNELFSMAKKEGLVKNGALSAGSVGSDKEKTFNRCMSKWRKTQFKTYDYKMVVDCIKQEFESYKKQAPTNDKTIGIEGYCTNKWPNDSKLREDCQNQMIEARLELYSLAEKEGLVKNGSLLTNSKAIGKEKIIHDCLSKSINNQFKIYDYKMVVDCIKNQ
ncbi:hypothetical protein [Desulfobacula sp.]|uniref:hypothetical protein n=1 Tax=Desulfobacula sp. TaxID=2593537 RepID=UPI001D69DB7F|nr:hypothetical protein [Desulfobacula sp.]